MRISTVKNYIYNVLYQLLVIAAPLVTAPYLASTLGADALGRYSYVCTVASVVSTIGLLGLYSYGVRQIAYIGDDKKATSKLFWEVMLLRTALLVLGVAVYAIVGVISQSTMLFVTYLPWLIGMYFDISWVYVGKENMRIAVIKNAFAKIVTIVGIFVFVKDADDVWKYLALVSFSVFVGNLSVWLAIKEYISFKPIVKLGDCKGHLAGALVLFLPQVATTIYLQVDKLMLRWISGESAIAFYDQAEKLINVPLTFITVLGTVMMPRIANEFKKGNKEEVSKLICSAKQFSTLSAIPLMLGICGIAKNLIPWYLGEEFLPVINVIYFIAPIIIFNSYSSVFGAQYLTATDQTKILTIACFSAAGVNLVINSILIPFFAERGAAIATLIASLVSIVIQLSYIRKQITIKIFDVNFIKCLVAGAFMIGIVILMEFIKVHPILVTVLQILGGATVYFIILAIVHEAFFINAFRLVLERLKWKKKS